MNSNEKENLREEVYYKGYEIEPSSYQLRNGEGWTLAINILKHSPGGVVSRGFSAKNIYKTEKEALKNCFIFGKQIIDGKHSGLTVSDL